MFRLKIQTKDSGKFSKQLPYAVEKDVWIFNQTTVHAVSNLIIHIMIWLGVGQDVFCGSVCRLVRSLAALYCALILSSERGTFCRGDGPVPVNPRPPSVRRRRTLIDLVPEQVQVYQSCDHVEFTVELTYSNAHKFLYSQFLGIVVP